MLKVLLANTNRSSLPLDLINELAIEQNIDIIIITEPNIYEAARTGWMADTVGDVVIKNMSGRLALSFKTRTEGFVVAETDSTIIAGAYVSPNISIGDYEKYLDSIHRILSCESKKVIMMGDFNLNRG
ncbi:uncharacterized protein LOC142326898 [Lycorma delicatula]|uniref:uncharacterized protein LOC142326898 n=1 Tax=Lycorma delicatula TaxID=130591 RepID=UPI003F51762E